MTDAELIKHLWTHKTQDHLHFSDEELMIERGEGVYVWTRNGKKLIDAYAGLSVVKSGASPMGDTIPGGWSCAARSGSPQIRNAQFSQ